MIILKISRKCNVKMYYLVEYKVLKLIEKIIENKYNYNF